MRLVLGPNTSAVRIGVKSEAVGDDNHKVSWDCTVLVVLLAYLKGSKTGVNVMGTRRYTQYPPRAARIVFFSVSMSTTGSEPGSTTSASSTAETMPRGTLVGTAGPSKELASTVYTFRLIDSAEMLDEEHHDEVPINAMAAGAILTSNHPEWKDLNEGILEMYLLAGVALSFKVVCKYLRGYCGVTKCQYDRYWQKLHYR
jgi:hypothetical protein